MMERKSSYDRALQYQRVPTAKSLDTRPFDEMSRYNNLEENNTHQTHSLANNLSAISDDEGDDVSEEAGGDENPEDTHNQGLSSPEVVFPSMDKLVLSNSSANNGVSVGNNNNEDNRSEAGTSKSDNSRTSRRSNRSSSRNSQATGSRTRSKIGQAGKPQDNIDNMSVFSYVSDANKSVAHSAAKSTKSAQSGSTSKSKSSRLSAEQASDAYLKICGGAGSSSAHDQLKLKMVSHVPVLEEAEENENGDDDEVVGEDMVRKSDAEEVLVEATADPTVRDSSSVDIEGVKDSTRNTDSANPTPSTLASLATPTNRDATPSAFPIEDIGIDNDKSKGVNGTRNRGMHNPKGLSITSMTEVTKVGDIPRVGSTSTDGTENVTLESGSNAEEDTVNLATLLLGDDASLIIDVAQEYDTASGSLIDTAPRSLITIEEKKKDEPGLLSSGVVSGLFERMFSCGVLPLQCNAKNVAGEVKSAAGEVKSIVKNIQGNSKNNLTRGESTIFHYEEEMDEALNIELFEDGNNGTRIMGHVNMAEEEWEDDDDDEVSSYQKLPSQPNEGGDGGSAARNAVKKGARAKNEHVSNKCDTNKMTSKSGKTGDDDDIDPSKVTSKIIYKTRVAPGFEIKSDSKNNEVIVDSVSAKIDAIGRKLEKKREREAAMKNGGGLSNTRTRKNRIRLNLFKMLKEKKQKKKLKKVARNGSNEDKGDSPSSSATRKEKRRRSKAVSKAAKASGGRPELNVEEGGGAEGKEYNDLNEPFDAQ